MSSHLLSVTELYEPLIAAVAARTAEIVLKEIQNNAGLVKPRWVPAKQAALRLGVTEKAVRERRQAGSIPSNCYKKWGGSVLYDLEALDSMMEGLSSH